MRPGPVLLACLLLVPATASGRSLTGGHGADVRRGGDGDSASSAATATTSWSSRGVVHLCIPAELVPNWLGKNMLAPVWS